VAFCLCKKVSFLVFYFILKPNLPFPGFGVDTFGASNVSLASWSPNPFK